MSWIVLAGVLLMLAGSVLFFGRKSTALQPVAVDVKGHRRNQM